MSVNVSFSLGQFPVGFCWTNPQDFAAAMVAILSGTISGNFGGVIIGQNLPDPSDQDKLWMRLNPDGTPDRIYKFLGDWLARHPVDPSSQFRWIWMGTEAALWSADGGDGSNPAFTAPTASTGAMWQRDTTFGADDGSSVFKVPVGIGQNPTAYDGNPAKIIGVGDTGGEQLVHLTLDKIPAHTHGVHAKLVQHGTADSPAYCPVTEDGQGDGVTLDITGGTSPPNAHSNMPPYIGCIFAKRTNRQFYVAS